MICDKDWELANAYHDGELSRKDAVRFEKRLKLDEELALAVDQISQISESLKGAQVKLRPQVVTEPFSLGKKFFFGGALAACLAIIVLFGLQKPKPDTPLAFHQALLEKPFSVSSDDLRLVKAEGSEELYDLSIANLTPVYLQDLPDGGLVHYSGVNGCRLSYVFGKESIDAPSKSNVQTFIWSTSDGVHHAIFASGMDQKKFDAIAAYLEQVTKRTAAQKYYAGLDEATKNSKPCLT